MNDHPPERDDNPRYRAAVLVSAREVWQSTGRPRRVLDVGCNIGMWSRAFAELGCDVTAIDSPHIEPHLLEPKPRFLALDLCQGFDIRDWFDLVLCLEVAEHLPEASADRLVRSLAGHASTVAFSAARPGQGGWKHINEQERPYWDARFAASGMHPDEGVRDRMPADLPAYYRSNLVIYRSRK